jgi:hypothetical protein
MTLSPSAEQTPLPLTPAYVPMHLRGRQSFWWHLRKLDHELDHLAYEAKICGEPGYSKGAIIGACVVLSWFVVGGILAIVL